MIFPPWWGSGYFLELHICLALAFEMSTQGCQILHVDSSFLHSYEPLEKTVVKKDLRKVFKLRSHRPHNAHSLR